MNSPALHSTALAYATADALSHEPTHIEDARAFVRRTAASLEALADALDGSFDQAVVALSRAHRIVVTGVGKSGLIGAKIAATLSSTGSPAHFLHPTEAAHGDLGIVTRHDAVLAISNSGRSAELTAIIEYCRRFRVPLIGITAERDSTLGRRASLILQLPGEAEAGPLPAAPMTSTTMTLVLGDALAAALIAEKGFTQDDFRNFHPGGRLGVQTLRLSRLIAEASPLPITDENHPMRVATVSADELLATASERIAEGGKGIVGVTENGDTRIVGSVTDGDVRRALPRIATGEATRVGDVMHPDPVHLADDALVADALATCEERRISQVFVEDPSGRVYATVHVQDLLRAGAI